MKFDFWTVLHRFPPRSRVTTRDGHTGAVEAVGFEGGVLSVWVARRGPVPASDVTEARA